MQGIPVPDEVFSRSTEGGFNVQREWTQAPSTGRGEERQLQNVFIQVHGDVCPQLVREVMQKLKGQVKHTDITHNSTGLIYSLKKSVW